jgi:hypothetical protein
MASAAFIRLLRHASANLLSSHRDTGPFVFGGLLIGIKDHDCVGQNSHLQFWVRLRRESKVDLIVQDNLKVTYKI